MEALILTLVTLVITTGIAGIGYCFYKLIPNSIVEKISEKLF